MAMRRIWVLVIDDLTNGSAVFQIDEDAGVRKPSVIHSLKAAQDEADDVNYEMQQAFSRGDLDSYDVLKPHPAWLVDETGIISLEIETPYHGILKIDDLQAYCEQEGQI